MLNSQNTKNRHYRYLEPGMTEDLLWGQSLLGVDDEQLLDEIPGLLRDIRAGREDVVGCDDLLPQPGSALLGEGRGPEQHLVQNDPLQVYDVSNDRETDYTSPPGQSIFMI